MDTYLITFHDMNGITVGSMEIKAIDYETAENIAYDLNSQYNTLVDLKED